MKTIDIEASSLSEKFKDWYSRWAIPTYKDLVLTEHLFDVTFDDKNIDEFPIALHPEIREIITLGIANDAAYFRIVND